MIALNKMIQMHHDQSISPGENTEHMSYKQAVNLSASDTSFVHQNGARILHDTSTCN